MAALPGNSATPASVAAASGAAQSIELVEPFEPTIEPQLLDVGVSAGESATERAPPEARAFSQPLSDHPTP